MLGTLLTLSVIAALPVVGQAQTPPTPITPIQHVIVIFGENRSFDQVFGTYVPRDGQTVHNLLLKGLSMPMALLAQTIRKPTSIPRPTAPFTPLTRAARPSTSTFQLH